MRVDLFVKEDFDRYVRLPDLQAVPRILLAYENGPLLGLLYLFLDLDLFVGLLVEEVELRELLLGHGQISTLASALITEEVLVKLREVFTQAHVQVFQDILHLLLEGILNLSGVGKDKVSHRGFLWREAFLASEFGRAEVGGGQGIFFINLARDKLNPILEFRIPLVEPGVLQY